MTRQPKETTAETVARIHASRVRDAAVAHDKGKLKFQAGMIWLPVADYCPDPAAPPTPAPKVVPFAEAREIIPARAGGFRPRLTQLAGQGALFRPAMGDIETRTEIESRKARPDKFRTPAGFIPDFFETPNPQPRAQKGTRT